MCNARPASNTGHDAAFKYDSNDVCRHAVAFRCDGGEKNLRSEVWLVRLNGVEGPLEDEGPISGDCGAGGRRLFAWLL